MPSWCIYSFLFQSFLLIFIFLNQTFSSNDNQHQILKSDVGQDVTMSCLFDEDKIEQVSFMRQMTGDILSVGSELFVQDTSANEHIKLLKISSNRLDLKLISVNENDSGIYTCMFNDERLSSFFLEILVPPRFLSYFPYEASIPYPEGSSMNLSCRAYAIPSANITWIYRDKNKQSKTIHNGEDVYISSLQSTDSGSYECIASNHVHASISRSFYVTVQYPPRVMIFNDKITSDVHDTVLVKCHICSIPELIQINWLRHDQMMMDVNIIIKTQSIDHYQCTESTMEIIDIGEYQFDRYECRAENNLGQNSSFINIEQNPQNVKLKLNEINRNGRTALLIDNHAKLNSTTNPDLLFNNLSVHKPTYFYYFLLVLIIRLRFL